MRVNFEVSGKDGAELEEEAYKLLAQLEPDIPRDGWLVQINARPDASKQTGEVIVWHAEVDAVTKTHREV